MRKKYSILFYIIVATLLSFYSSGFCLAQDLPNDVTQLLRQCLKSPDALPQQAVDALQLSVNRNDAAIRDLFAKEAVKIGGGGDKGAAFQKKVFEAIDRRQFQLADELAKKVAEEMGDGVEMVIRTGSSGSRHMQLNNKPLQNIRYDLLVSDDDISFIGARAEEAAAKFNALKKGKGLTNARISAFSLSSITDATSYDLLVQQIRNSDAFVGAAGFGKIREEILEKGGAVILIRQGNTILPVAQTVQDYVAKNAGSTLAGIVDVATIAADLKKFGPLTMYGSAVRQMGHAGVTQREQVKYLLRIYAAMDAAGSFTDAASMGGRQTSYFREVGEQLRAAYQDKTGKAAAAFFRHHNLQTLKSDAFESVILSTTRKLQLMVAQAEKEAGKGALNIARHPELRRMIHEMAAGFALMDQTGHAHVLQEVVPDILKKMGAAAEKIDLFYRVLYTAAFDATILTDEAAKKVVVRGVTTWARARTPEGLITAMSEAGQNGRHVRQTLAEVAAQRMQGKSAEGAQQLQKVLAESNGDTFLWKMLSSQTAQKFMIEGLAMAPFATWTMYQEWQKGEMKDLSDAAFVLIDFVPGGMSTKKLGTEGLTPSTVLMFAKEALYFTPAWPFVLAGDVMYLSWTVGGAIQLQTVGEGLVDILVYAGDFEVGEEGAKLTGVTLPDGTAYSRDEVYDFLFKTKAVRVRHAVSGLEYYVNNLSEKSFKVLDGQFIPQDATMEQMRLAIQQHLDAINWSEASQYFYQGNVGGALAGYVNYVAGFEFVVNADKGKPWAKLYEHLQNQMANRRTVVAQTIMVPQLILLAEQKRTTLDASTTLPQELAALQEKFEQLRGSDLEVQLVDAVGALAKKAADALTRGTAEEKLLASGQVWQEALAAYTRIWELSATIPSTIEERTGYAHAKPLAFVWSGIPKDDLRKAEQSKVGFASDLGKIRRDLMRIAKREPNVSESVDRQAYDILASVVFPWRMGLDKSDSDGSTRSEAFTKEYEEALEKVKALYGLSQELQAQVEQGATLAGEQVFLILDTAMSVELRVKDDALQKEIDQGALKITWLAAPGCTVKSSQALQARVTTHQLEPVTITAVFERTGATKAKAALAMTLPVRVDENFLTVSVKPTTAKPGQSITATADIPERFFGEGTLVYRWACENCQLDDEDRATVDFTAGQPGPGRVRVVVAVAGSDGSMEVLTSGQAKFTVQDHAEPPKPEDAPAPEEILPPLPPDAGGDEAGKPTENQPDSPQEAATSTSGQEQSSGQAEQNKDDGTWFKSGLSGGWQVKHNESGYWAANLKREISAPSKLKECGRVTVSGTINAKLESTFVPTSEEIDKKLRGFVEGNGWYPKEEGIQNFSIGEYTGRMITTTVKHKDGFGNPMAGYRGGTAHSFGYAIVLHKTERRMISANYSVYANGCWDNSEKDIALAQVTAARAQAMGIIQGLSLHETEQQSPVTADAPVVEVEQAEEEKEKKYQLTLTRVSPASGPVIVGTPVTYKATLSGDKPEGEVRYQFEPHPDVALTPHEGPSASTTAVFLVPGKVGVWVTAVDKTGTIATADQVEIEVLQPTLELVIEPKEPLVGQEVKARLTVKPEVKNIDFRWMPVSGNAKHVATAKDNREITFYLKDEKAVEIQVNARVPFSGEDLGEARASVTAKKYAVSVSAPKAQGPPPQIWKEGVGLVTVDKAIAVDQIVEFSAAVQPEVSSGPIKYQWTVENGPCRVSNPSSSVARVTANAAGTCNLSVTLRDRNDVELGAGQGSFSASVTQEAVQKGQQKAQSVRDASALVKSAAAKERRGDYDGAIADAKEAARLDPANKEGGRLANRLEQDRRRIEDLLAKTRELMDAQRFQEADQQLTAAQNISNYYPPVQALVPELSRRWTDYRHATAKHMDGVRVANQDKHFERTLELAKAFRDAMRVDESVARDLDQAEAWAKRCIAEQQKIIAIFNKAENLLQAHDYAQAVATYRQGLINTIQYFPADHPEMKRANDNLAEADRKLKRLNELRSALQGAVGRMASLKEEQVKLAIATADEALQLQPGNGHVLEWKAQLVQKLEELQKADTPAAVPSGGEASPLQAPGIPTNSASTSSVDMRGEWNHVGNGWTTKLIVKQQDGSSFSGVMHGDPLINGRIEGDTVTFTRDIPQRQDYTGTLQVEADGTMRMSGTFSQKGTSVIYRWNSSRKGDVPQHQTPASQEPTHANAPEKQGVDASHLGVSPANGTDESSPANGKQVVASGQQETAGQAWVLVDSKILRGETPEPVEGGEARVDIGTDTIELLLAKPYGNGVYGSKDRNNPQRMHAQYSWTMPSSILPGGQVVVPVTQRVLSNKTGNYASSFGVAVSIENRWDLTGATADGQVVKSYALGLGGGKPDWIQQDLTVTYQRDWLWTTGQPGSVKTVTVTVGGVGTHKFEYRYEWK